MLSAANWVNLHDILALEVAPAPPVPLLATHVLVISTSCDILSFSLVVNIWTRNKYMHRML